MLALIAQRPRYGFELIQSLDEAGLLVVGDGIIYPLHSRMQNDRLIEAFVITSGETGRKRKYYRILGEGERKLAEWNEQWSRFQQGMDSVVGRYRHRCWARSPRRGEVTGTKSVQRAWAE